MFPIVPVPSQATLLYVSFTASINGVIVQVGQSTTGSQVAQGVGSDEESVTEGPEGGVPVAIAKLFTCPASISACVIT